MSPLSSTHCEYYPISPDSARRTRHALQAETMGDGYVSAILKTAPVRDGIRLGVMSGCVSECRKRCSIYSNTLLPLHTQACNGTSIRVSLCGASSRLFSIAPIGTARLECVRPPIGSRRIGWRSWRTSMPAARRDHQERSSWRRGHHERPPRAPISDAASNQHPML